MINVVIKVNTVQQYQTVLSIKRLCSILDMQIRQKSLIKFSEKYIFKGILEPVADCIKNE